MNDDELEVSGNTEVETTAEVNPGTEVKPKLSVNYQCRIYLQLNYSQI